MQIITASQVDGIILRFLQYHCQRGQYRHTRYPRIALQRFFPRYGPQQCHHHPAQQSGYGDTKGGKQNYQAGKYADKVDSVMKDIDELLQNGVISGNGGKQAAMQLKKCLNMAKLGKNGRAAQARNRVGK